MRFINLMRKIARWTCSSVRGSNEPSKPIRIKKIQLFNNLYLFLCLFLIGHMLDTLARTSLWNVGLDYLHGTGHGVGAFLNVHEGMTCVDSSLAVNFSFPVLLTHVLNYSVMLSIIFNLS